MDGPERSDPGRIRRVPLTPDRYDQRWEELAARGAEVHGEADLVASLLGPPSGAVLDAGCGTGRLAIELARRGYTAVGVDVDPALLDRARAKAPALEWHLGDLADLPATTAPGPFAAAVLAGNVMIFVARGTEPAVLATVAARVAPGGLVVAGFQITGRLSLAEYDDAARAAGLVAVDRFATWDRAPFDGSAADYVVTVDSKR
jgi:SAM-dependent methyltransferase